MPSTEVRRPSLRAVILRALLYALLITLLVVFAPGEEHVFIYQGF
jgi:hypothetical protein